ncbi:ABC transporter related protein [Halorhabdus tiamatea SARL4B]|uniref:ABC transporter related protein n=1 Tax=Halorhabdus tiamatea SARL4B TaxID=1033806 RepID=F7PMW0_9EURY|nr:ABC transporter ATP-binding protein [Halorhabdus tiamatea]ERJ07667.1 ABC transporter related protein [Halorhabdus tiamatea SARL4B]CCQ32676.1 ABC transporter, ATP-binding protein [Halorhabdus tiamatea SARL4B]
MTAIETAGLTKRYGELTALDDLSLTVESGSLFGLLGPNGSGKTTTIELLTGQRTPDSGSARVLGIDPVANPREVRAAVGILPEREDPPSFLTPREYLQFVGEVRDLEDVTERIERWADRLEFTETLDTVSADLSEGQRQRVMLGATFVHDPDLVFIDEPLVNLDPILQERVKRELRAYCEEGNTLFLSTHFVDVAADLCDRVAILDDGHLRGTQATGAFDDEDLLSYFLDTVDGGDVATGVGDGADGPTAAIGPEAAPEGEPDP